MTILELLPIEGFAATDGDLIARCVRLKTHTKIIVLEVQQAKITRTSHER